MHNQLFDQSSGKKPFFLLDDHNSCLSKPFVTYIRDIEHEWCVCFGTPYATNLWQVGNSEEQNGSYKMSMTRYKDEIIRKKLTKKWARPCFEDTDIVVAVGKAWKDSFGQKHTNKLAISSHGWDPYNQNLLLHKDIRATMNDDDKEWEKNNLEISPHSMQTIFAEQNLDLLEDKDLFLQPKYSTN